MKKKIQKDFPKRETQSPLPFLQDEHIPDKDGRTSYGRDGETTYKD